MPISNRLAVIIIIVCACAAHVGTLFNGFVGDDNMLIVNNTAYRSWDNFGRLLFEDYIIDIDDILNGETKFLGSSDVSYRPVKSATHFVDYAIWKLNPFGYHLHNLILHALNAVLMFFLLNLIFRNVSLSLFAATLFVVHPIQSEAVSAINYRHNLLIAFFLLSAMLSYIRSYKSHKVFYLLISYVMFFLAVFSKEAALIFPLIVLAYDVLIREKSGGAIAKSCVTDYLGFWAVIGFFGYVYVYVFPNVVSESNAIFGGSWTAHFVYLTHIFLYYLQAFIMPWTVKSLPPYYNVQVENLWGVGTYLGIFSVCAMVWLCLHSYKTNRKVCFMLFWFMASYAIVSNIIPFANPVSFRFMYFPAIGMFAVLAYYLYIFLQFAMERAKSGQLTGLIKVCIIIVCISWTWPLDAAWKSDNTMTIKMYKDFPDNAKANMYAGMTLYRMQHIPEAEQLLTNAYQMKLDDPRVYHYLGLIYLNDYQKAEPLFEQCIDSFPRFAACYAGAGRLMFLTERYKQALLYLDVSREKAPNYPTYGYLIQLSLLNNKKDLARSLYLEAVDKLEDQEQLASLSRLFQEDHNRFPIDLGF